MGDIQLSDIAALLGNRNDNNGFGGDDGLLLLVIILLFGGWGRGGWGNQGAGGYGAGGVGGNELYPWLNNADQINGGFRDQMIQTTLQGIQTQGQNLATQLCNCCGDMQMALANGFAGVNNNLCNGFSATQNTINQGFNATNMGMMQGFNGVNMQAAQLASDIQLGNAQQTATILAENCADRAALSDGVRDIIANQTAVGQRQIDNQNAGIQSILDKLCQLELDGYKRQLSDEQRANADLRSQLTQARFDASQQAQNAFIQNGFASEVDALYNRLNNCPVPSMPVYGRTPIFQCQPQNQGCGCNCGGM